MCGGFIETEIDCVVAVEIEELKMGVVFGEVGCQDFSGIEGVDLSVLLVELEVCGVDGEELG